jgi:hypothetical protein
VNNDKDIILFDRTFNSVCFSFSIEDYLENNATHIRHVYLCSSDFQRKLDMLSFNRTLIIYNIEWRSCQYIDIVFLLVEHEDVPMIYIGDLALYLDRIYILSNVNIDHVRHKAFYVM